MNGIQFKARTRTVEYGDNRTFVEYQILMSDRQGLAGVEAGPNRETKTRNAALKAARARIRILKSHRLFAVRVTKQHIDDGDARNCHSCAISQALWHNQERMGLSKYEYSFEVSPYAAWVEARGIVLSKKYSDEDTLHIPEDEMPDLFIGQRGKHLFTESMMEWAMSFDEWSESKYLSEEEWAEEQAERGNDDTERPWRPSPASFVLDLDAMQPSDV